jgi:hypothetical protein
VLRKALRSGVVVTRNGTTPLEFGAFLMVKSIRLQLKLYDKNQKMVRSTYSGNRNRISYIIRTTPASFGYLKVVYNEDNYNDSPHFAPRAELKDYLSIFTEKDLVDKLQAL